MCSPLSSLTSVFLIMKSYPVSNLSFISTLLLSLFPGYVAFFFLECLVYDDRHIYPTGRYPICPLLFPAIHLAVFMFHYVAAYIPLSNCSSRQSGFFVYDCVARISSAEHYLIQFSLPSCYLHFGQILSPIMSLSSVERRPAVSFSVRLSSVELLSWGHHSFALLLLRVYQSCHSILLFSSFF